MRSLPLAVFVIFLLLLCGLASAHELQCDPCDVGFGHVAIGTSKTLYVNLTNEGNKTLKIKSKAKTGDAFSFGSFPLPMSLAPGRTARLPLKFKPTKDKWTSGSATLSCANAKGPLTISLAGTGMDPKGAQLKLMPSSLDFGNVMVGESATLALSLSASNGSVRISSDDLTSPEFSVQGLVLPLTVASGQSAQIKVTFTPTSRGDASARLILNSDASNSPTADVLAGTGGAPHGHSVSLSWNPDKDPVMGYNIYRSAGIGGPYTMINNALVATTDYTDNAVNPGKKYFYAVTAVNAGGQESGYSNKVKAVIPDP